MTKRFIYILYLVIGSCLVTQAQQTKSLKSDAVVYIYDRIGDSFFYLSAIDGGGDEVVARKITSQPGINEEFVLEFIEVREKGYGLFALKTMEGDYVEITGDGEIMAEEKELNTRIHSFEMKLMAPNQQVKEFDIVVRKRLQKSQNGYLMFSPPIQDFQITRADPDNPPIARAKWVADGFEKLKFGPVKYELEIVFDAQASADCENMNWEGNLVMGKNYPQGTAKKNRQAFKIDLSKSNGKWAFANTVNYSSAPLKAKIKLVNPNSSSERNTCLVKEIRIEGEETKWKYSINQDVKAGDKLKLFPKGKYRKSY